MEKKANNTILSIDITKCDNFDNTFVMLYKLLDSYGEKKKFQLELIEQTSPPEEIDLLRSYCTRPNVIPKNKRKWWLTNMSMRISYVINQKLEKAKIIVNNAPTLLEKLEFYYNQEIKENEN